MNREELLEWVEKKQATLDAIKEVAASPPEREFHPMSLYMENLRNRSEMEAARSRGWMHGAAVFSYLKPDDFKNWCVSLKELGISGRVSLNEDCFDRGLLSQRGKQYATALAEHPGQIDGVELENDSPYYARRMQTLMDAGVSSVFQYQTVHDENVPNLSKLWYSLYGQASEDAKAHVGSIKAWRHDPFNVAPMRSFSVWGQKRTTGNRPDGKTKTGHVWIECMGDVLGNVVEETGHQDVAQVNESGRWHRKHESRYAIPPGRGHFDYYLWTCHRMSVNQVTFYAARNQAWGDRMIWDGNPKLWEDLIESVRAYMKGPLGLPNTWSREYKNSNPFVTTIGLK